jgi:hypothetical protein
MKLVRNCLVLLVLNFLPLANYAQDNPKPPKSEGGSKQQRDADKKKQKRLEAGYKLVEKEEKKRFKRQSKETKKLMKETKKKSEKMKHKRHSYSPILLNEQQHFASNFKAMKNRNFTII